MKTAMMMMMMITATTMILTFDKSRLKEKDIQTGEQKEVPHKEDSKNGVAHSTKDLDLTKCGTIINNASPESQEPPTRKHLVLTFREAILTTLLTLPSSGQSSSSGPRHTESVTTSVTLRD